MLHSPSGCSPKHIHIPYTIPPRDVVLDDAARPHILHSIAQTALSLRLSSDVARTTVSSSSFLLAHVSPSASRTSDDDEGPRQYSGFLSKRQILTGPPGRLEEQREASPCAFPRPMAPGKKKRKMKNFHAPIFNLSLRVNARPNSRGWSAVVPLGPALPRTTHRTFLLLLWIL